MLQRTPTESEIESEDPIATISEPTIATRYLIVPEQDPDDQFTITNTSNSNSSNMFTTPTSSPTHMEYNNTLASVTPPALVEDVDRTTSPYGRLTKTGGNSFLHPMLMTKTNGVSHSASSSSGISLRSSSTSSSNSNCSNTNATNNGDEVGSGGVPHNGNSSSTSIGVNLRVTGQCSQGGRKYMEDYFSVAYQEAKSDMTTNGIATNNTGVDNGGGGGGVSKELEYAFFGIYDGHGGAEAALFAKENLMIEIVSQKAFWSDSDEDVMRAIREGYIATHFAMWREHERWPRTANGHLSTAGTTATVAFLRREKIYIGHVGDSGVVLGYQNEHENFWRAKQLTTDHKPESTLERKRIQRSGGSVTVKSGVPRVVWNRPRDPTHRGPIRQSTPVDDIPFLAVARSLGDLWSYNSEYNEFVVSPDPDVKVVKINPKTFRCLIFGTDGLWNVVSAQEAVDSVFEKERINNALRLSAANGNVSSATCMQSANPSKALVEKAIKTWSSKKMRADNTSVVTVILYPNKVTNASDDALPNSNSLKLVTPTPPQLPPLPHHFMFGNDILIDEYVPTMPYSQVAKMYLPPLEYRNFNYYEEEEDEELIVEASMRLDYTDEDDDDDDEDDDDVVDADETLVGADNVLGVVGGLPAVHQYGTHLLASTTPERSHCAWDAFDRGSSSSGGGGASKSAWLKSALEVCMPQTNEWVELEIDRDSDAISAEISTTSTTLTTTTCAPRPPSVVESMAMDVDYCRSVVNDDAAGVDELYSEEVYVDAIEGNELVELDVVEPHSFERFMHSDNAMDTDQSTTGYTFAESYNLLLNGQEARNSSTSRSNNAISSSTSSSSTASGGAESGASGSSSSNSSGMSSPTTYQSIDSTSMQEILQEQQRYQEQEGYSLTKLETRREQQRSAASSTYDDERVPAEQSVGEWNQHYVTTTIEQQQGQHDNDNQSMSRYHERQEQLLELNSLLQQEREEERLVALEQREMQQRLLKHNNNNNNNDDESNEDDATTSVNNVVVVGSTADMITSDYNNAMLDYANAEETSDDYVLIEAESELMTTAEAMKMSDDTSDDNVNVNADDVDDDDDDHEKTLQINEVSSTDVPEPAERTIEAYVQKAVDEIRQEDNTAVTFIFEQIKKLKDIEYTPVSKTVKAAVQRAVAIAAGCTNATKMSASPSDTTATSSASIGRKTRRMRYRNIPNENMMQTRRKGTCAKFKRKTHSFINNAAAAIIAYNATPSSSSRTKANTNNGNVNANNNSTKTIERSSGGGVNANVTVRSPYATRNEVRISKRQLRSTVCNLDITQRTLRTRNHALPKDLKNGVSSAQRTAAAQQQQQQQTTNSYQKRTTTAQLGCGAVTHRSTVKSAPMTNATTNVKHQQNLRQTLLVKRAASEQTTRTLNVNTTTPPAKRTAPSISFTPPVAYLNLRSRRRNNDEPPTITTTTPTTTAATIHQKNNSTPMTMNAVAAVVAANGKRFEYRRSLRRSNVIGNSGSNSVGGIASNVNNSNVNLSNNVSGGTFSKSTRLQSGLSAISARPPPSPKKLTITSIGSNGGSSGVSSVVSSNTNNARQAIFAAAAAAAGKDSKTTKVLVDFSKRWSLRSKRGALPLTAPTTTTTTTMSINTSGTAGGGAAAVAATTAAALAARTSLENAINCYTNSNIASRTRLNRKR